MIETRLGDFEETILLLVGILDEEAYAVRISDEFESQTGRKVSIGAVHSTLNRLTEKAFLDSEMGTATAKRGGRRKRIYRVSASGQQALRESRDFKLALWRQYPPFATGNLSFNA